MKRHLPLIVPAAIAVVLIVFTSIVQGLWTDRFAPTMSEELNAFATAMKSIPNQIGDWDSQEGNAEMDPMEREAAGAVGDLSRKYRNPNTQEEVSVYMICGASRNVAIHTPDACYTGSGFEMEGNIESFPIEFEDSTAEFHTAVFLKADTSGGDVQRLRVFWAWNADGTWESPKFPRMKYGGRTPLNKIYFIAPSPASEQIEENSAVEFAKEFLPVVTPLLFPANDEEPASDPSAEEASPAEKGETPSPAEAEVE